MDIETAEAVLRLRSELGAEIFRKDIEIARLKAALAKKDKDIADLVRLLKEGRALVSEYAAAVEAAKSAIERAAQEKA